MKTRVWSNERGFRTLKEGVKFDDYKNKYPSAIRIEPLDNEELETMMLEEDYKSLDGCSVEPDGICEHGYPSWLRALHFI